jgi:pimeloyl-ACP methyl ester carboxylesterase
MLSRFLSFSFILLSSFLTQSYAVELKFSTAQCDLIFSKSLSTYRQPTLESLHKASTEAQLKSGWKAPTFVTPAQEMELYKTRQGIVGPTFVQNSLVPGDKLIPSALIDPSEPGVVKTRDGIMVHIQGNIRGKSFVMGVSNYSLAANETRTKKYYVSDDSRNVIIWVHGGGTGTTGHHTAANLMAYFRSYKVDVISVDMSWHAHGTREDFSSAKEVLDFLADFRHKYIPEGTNAWLAGHSMGGAISLLNQQKYGDRKDVFAGIMALSPVIDVLPGGSIVQKNQEFERLDAINRTNKEMPVGDRILGEMLARQGKISPVCGLFCDLLIYSLDAQEAMKPEKNIPTMILIGKGDGLYQGSEKHFDSLARHPGGNIQLHVLGQRRSMKDKEGGKLENVGHMVFDNKPIIHLDQDLSQAALDWLEYIPAQSEAAIKAAKDYRKKFQEGKITRPILSREFKKQIVNGRVTHEYLNVLKDQGLISWDPKYTAEDLSEIETFVLMRKFISQVSGQDLVKHIKTSGPDSTLHVRYNFINNLVFRQFAESYIYTHERNSELKTSLGKNKEVIKRFQTSLRDDLNGSRKVSEADMLPFTHVFVDNVLDLSLVKKSIDQSQISKKESWIQQWDRWIAQLTDAMQNPNTQTLLQNFDLLRKMQDLKQWVDQNKGSLGTSVVGDELQRQLTQILQTTQFSQQMDRQKVIQFLIEGITAYSMKVETILKGLDIPQDETGPKVAELLKQIENLRKDLRDQRKIRSDLKLKIRQESEKKKQIASMLLSLGDWVRSDLLKDLYNQNEEAYQKMNATELRIREKNTKLLSSRYNGQEFVGGTFGSLPADLVADYELYANQKQEYRRISAEYEQTLLSEFELGHAKLKSLQGPNFGKFLNSIHRGIVMLLIDGLNKENGSNFTNRMGLQIHASYSEEGLKSGEEILVPKDEEVRQKIRSYLEHIIHQLGQDLHSNGVLLHALTDEARVMDNNLAQLQTDIFHLDNEIYQLRGQKYFTYEYYTFMSLLNMPLEWYAVPENRAEINNLFQKIWKEWQEMWGDRQGESNESLY